MSDHLITTPSVVLLARPQFLGVPAELGRPRGENVVEYEWNDDGKGCSEWSRRPTTAEDPNAQDVGTDAERLIEAAGRVCYDSYGKGRGSAAYHEHLQDVGHGSVTEHACWSFLLSGVSRGLTHELVRHRVGVAYAQRSTRYVDESEADWVVPPLFVEREGDAEKVVLLKRHARRRLDGARNAATDAYVALDLVGNEILALTAPDLPAADRRKVVRGAARAVLGTNVSTQIVFSANLRALAHICLMRCVRYADAEIRGVAAQLARIMAVEAPAYFARAEFHAAPDGLGDEVTGLPRMQAY